MWRRKTALVGIVVVSLYLGVGGWLGAELDALKRQSLQNKEAQSVMEARRILANAKLFRATVL